MLLATEAPAKADSKGLRTVGFVFVAVTAAIILVAGAVVHAHVDGRSTLDDDDASYQASALSSPRPSH
jgi:hypothetical protein